MTDDESGGGGESGTTDEPGGGGESGTTDEPGGSEEPGTTDESGTADEPGGIEAADTADESKGGDPPEQSPSVAGSSLDEPRATVLSLVEDDCARAILAATSEQPHSAAELADRIDASRQTVYRRVDRLQAADLLEEGTRLRSDGHHDAVYVATLSSVQVRVDDGEVDVSVDRTAEDPADRLTDLWRNF